MNGIEDLIARVDEEEADEGSTFLVRAPAVGVICGLPEPGTYLNPLQTFVTLETLGRRHAVRLPRQTHGRVMERFVEGIHQPVEFGQPLVRLSVRLDLPTGGKGKTGKPGEEEADGEELISVPSPTDGIFYRRPGPDSPAYVEVGSAIQKGTVLGLVEVMKSFNQIVYGGVGLPDKGSVVEIKAEDAAEVAVGAPLFLIRPE